MNIKHICFDLDGTLVKSDKTIYKATLTTLKHLNIKADIPEQKFYKMIGLHFVDIFNELNLDVPDFEKFIGIYKNIYFDFIDDSKLYNNVVDVLLSLKNDKDIKLSLLTTKGQDQAEKIIKHFNLNKHFDLIMGRRDGIAHKPSAEPLLFICNELEVDTKDTMIVGDTELDILCGKNAGAITCGVTYGYRTEGSLKENNPDYLVNDFSEIKSLMSE
ncbi:MAG: HAD-IA family hydrolase [Ignavibacteria bacterium]|nr:HAD-IA family hydrolase [Ignavibacteria bacterium]